MLVIFGKSQDFKTILNAFKSGKIEKNIYLNLIGFGKEFKKIQTLIDEEDLSSKIKLSSYLEKKELLKMNSIIHLHFLLL